MRASNVFGPALPGSAERHSRGRGEVAPDAETDAAAGSARVVGGVGVEARQHAGQAEDAEGGDEFDRDHLAQQRALSLQPGIDRRRLSAPRPISRNAIEIFTMSVVP